MKNKIGILALGLIMLSIMPSCKKNGQNCKLGKYYLSDGSTTPAPDVFAYYSDGRLKSILHSNGSKDTISYNSDSITVLTFNRNGVLVTNFSGNLNSTGAVVWGFKTSYDLSGNITGTDVLAFEYNGAGQLTKQTTNNTVLSLHYTNANADTGTVKTGPILHTRYFFYHNKVENKTKVDDLNSIFMPWLGNPSANLLDSTHIIQLLPADTTRIQYTHTLDDNGYLSKTAQSVFNNGVSSTVSTYQYFDCR